MGYQYIYDFDIGTILFFGLTIIFYLYQKRLRNLQDGIFTAMLVCSMVAVIFDFLSALMDYNAMAYPVWLLYLSNILFIFGMQSCLPLFFLYSIAMAGKFNRFSTKLKLISAVPYIVTMALLFLSPFVSFGICTIDAAHIYQHGPTHGMLYVSVGIAVLLANLRTIQRVKRDVILLFAVLLFAAMALQILFPRYLLTASATALALTSVFHVLQSPADQVNPLTGAFSRTLLPSLLQDYIERGRLYTLLLFSLRSFDNFVRLYGGNAGDDLLRAYAEELTARFDKEVVVFMDTAEFIVVHKGAISREEVKRLYESTPSAISLAGRGAVPIDVRIGAVPFSGGKASEDLTTADHMLREMRMENGAPWMYADAEYVHGCTVALRLEASIGELLHDKHVTLTFSDIASADGTPVARDVILCAENIPHAQFLQAVGRGGHTWDYYETLFSLLKEHESDCPEGFAICTKMIAAAFLQEDAPDNMANIVKKHGFAPENIIFAGGEAEIAASAQLAKNIERLDRLGFVVMVDTFAEGFTDMSLLSALPLKYARLHESFVKCAVESERHAKLLQGLIDVLNDIGITAVCPEISSNEERAAALGAGARLLQTNGAI